MSWVEALSALIVASVELVLFRVGPFAAPPGALAYTDLLYLLLLISVFWPAGSRLAALWLRSSGHSEASRGVAQQHGAGLPAELLLFAVAALFLFSYIYASNANMDYVQRFVATHGNVRLAPDTRTERTIAAVRYLPLLLLSLALYLRAARRRTVEGGRWLSVALRRWALIAVSLSAVAQALAFPSFVSLRGWSGLAWVALAPMAAVVALVSVERAAVYGLVYGVLHFMVVNYWLGTYSLISLQAVTVVNGVLYGVFLAVCALLYRVVGRRLGVTRFLLFPAAWVAWEWVRSLGYAGYPWALVGVSQYRFIPLIQVAELTGVWGVSFLVLLVVSALAEVLLRVSEGYRLVRKVVWFPLAGAGVAVGLAVLVGVVVVESRGASGTRSPRTVRLALVQQNSDPRKNDYDETFRTLVGLTDQAAGSNPDLVVWSETAFVPNIRRWSRVDPSKSRLAALVRRFLLYQRRLGRWLVTGNDDYDFVPTPTGEERFNYNAAVLFSPPGRREATYHKMRLVPVTEYFPWKRQLPGVYRMLQNFDVYLWEPGTRRVVFHHPLFSFSTPICFEDIFPDDVRRFVLQGAQVITVLSNDYWSLTEVEGKQHAVHALFRAVENRRPLLRATASGLTVYVDGCGRIRKKLPYYRPALMVVDVALPVDSRTLYTRWGDWFPLVCLGIVAVMVAGSLAGKSRRGRGREREDGWVG